MNNLSIIEFVCFQLDEANAQERLEEKIKNAPEGQGTVRMLTREEWEMMREIRPRTPFESTIARPNAKIRTGEPLRKVNQACIMYLLVIFLYIELLSESETSL